MKIALHISFIQIQHKLSEILKLNLIFSNTNLFHNGCQNKETVHIIYLSSLKFSMVERMRMRHTHSSHIHK